MQNGDRVNFTACTNIPSSSSDSTFYAQLEKNRLSIGDVPVGDGRDIVVNVIGTQTQPTASWIGGLDWPSLPNGLKISYYLPYENTGEATLDLTLPDNTSTGAVPVYFKGDVRLTTQFNANSTIDLTYFTAGSISIDGQATATARWVCSDTIDAIQSIEPSDELGYIETTNTAGHTEKVSPYYGTAPSAAQQMPFNFTSVKSSNLEDYTIYGNNNPNRIDETRTTLPMTVSAYGGNATDWEIYGNNNPVVETKTGVLPIEASATAGAASDWVIEGNDNISKNYYHVPNSSTTASVTFTTDTTAGTVTASGTASGSTPGALFYRVDSFPEGNYYLSGCPEGGGTSSYNMHIYDVTTRSRAVSWDETTLSTRCYSPTDQVQVHLYSDHTYRLTMQVLDGVTVNDIVFKPMLRPADTTADFEPYQIGVGQRTKNLLEITATSSTSSGVSYVANKNDGTIIANGTAQGNSTFQWNCELAAGSYALSGCLSQGSASTFGLNVSLLDWSQSWWDYGSGAVINLSESTTVRVRVVVYNGATVNNLVFKPMLRAADTSAEFIPFGYEIPLTVNSTPQTFYIGDSPLTAGQSITKAQSGQDVTLFSGDNIIDTSLYNKPNTSITYNSSVLGVGKRTNDGYILPITVIGENLFDKNATALIQTDTNTYRSAVSLGKIPAGTYTLSYIQSSTPVLYVTKRTGTSYNNSTAVSPYTFSVANSVDEVIIRSAQSAITPWEDLGISNIMVTHGSTAPSTYIPYTATNYTFQLGSSPLAQGQSISKSTTHSDITLYSGSNTISTTLGNKPEMRIDYLSAEVGVGERTVNLFDKTARDTNNGYVNPGRLRLDGTINTASVAIEVWVTEYIAVESEHVYTLVDLLQTSTYGICYYGASKTYLSGEIYNVTNHGNKTVTTPANCKYVRFTAAGGYDTMLVKGSTAPTTFIPYGYQIPISVSQGSQVLDAKNIYIGTSLLTQGQSITKTQAGVDIYAPRGVDTMDSTLYNKPSMSLVATCGIDGYIDSKLDTFNNQQVIPKIQALHDKLKLDIDQRFGFPNGGYNWMYYYGKLSSDDGKISLAAADIGTKYYEVSANNATSTSYTIEQKFNAITLADDSNERYIRALPEGDYHVLIAFGGWAGTAGAATFELEVDVTHDGSTTTSTITEASPYYYWGAEDLKFYYADIHVDVDTQEMGEVSIYDVVTLNYNFVSSTSDYSDFDGAPIWVWIAEVGKFESEILPDFEEMVWGLFYPVHDTVATDVNRLNQRIALVDSILSSRIAALDAIINTQNAGAHNAIYRGKYLGTSVSSTAYYAIDAGTFDDLYVGDYWTINGINWRIAAFDYYLNTGDTNCTTHHIVVVPDTTLYSAQYHITESGAYEAGTTANTTAGGYQGSDLRTGVSSDGWPDTNFKGLYKDIGALGIIKAAFGEEHILTHRQYLVNAVTDGHPSAGAWYDSQVELMTEQNVYGCKIFGPIANGSAVYTNYTLDKSQFPLFALDPTKINIRQTYWLRDVVSASDFAYVHGDGNAACRHASRVYGVRPAFAIRKAPPATT